MVAQTSRRSFMTGVAATATAATLLPVAAIAQNAGGGSEELAYHTANDLVKTIAGRQVSSRELVDSAISRIEALDAKIDAVVVRDFERARAAADAADAALAKGKSGALLGVPMTVKEHYAVAGLPTTRGDPKYKNWKAEVDALVVQRLKSAGAIILGKTKVPVDLGDWQSYNEVYGTPNNPWDLTRSPGGSSGAAAAALAAGFVPLELGSDIGGSLRCPAHFCGVFSHKPSLDLVPQRGAGPPQTTAIPVRVDLAVNGPMARSAADLALELAVVAGPDELMDGIGYKLALPPPRHDKLADFRVLVIDKHPLCPTAPSISAALNGLADRLAKLGCTVLRASPKMPDLARTARNYVELLAAFFSADTSPDERLRGEAAAQVLSPDDLSISAARLRGFTMSHPAWIQTSRIRSGLRAGWQALFEDVDVMLCPPMPTVAFPHDHSSPQWARQLDVDGKKVPYDNPVAWAGIATSNWLPATTMPIGHDESGLPIGVQIIGGYLDDRSTIAFAGLVEREFGGFAPPPNL